MAISTTARPSTSLAERIAPTLRPATWTSCPGRICSAEAKAARRVCGSGPSPARTMTPTAATTATSARTATRRARLATEGDPPTRAPEHGGQRAADDVDEHEIDDHRPRGRRADPLGPARGAPAVVEADQRDDGRERHGLGHREDVVHQRLALEMQRDP